MKPISREAYNLFHEGMLAFADIEANGFCVDVPYLDNAIEKIDKKVNRLTERLKQTDIWKQWERKYRHKANLTSRKQLGDMLFKELGYKGSLTIDDEGNERENGQYKTDEDALEKVDHPFVKTYIKRAKLEKAKGTYLLGIRNETVDGRLHCFFNLHTVRTYRSSADRPNLQNQPNRNPLIAEIVRRCFIPRKGHQLLEIDYGALEVRGIACYSHDPVLIEEVEGDPHTQWAQACYMVNDEEVNKVLRFYAKNQFVFPEFYGSYYVDCARNLWEFIDRFELKTSAGISLYEHLRKKGIKKLGTLDPRQKPRKGTFEKHISDVEKVFRYEKYKVHTQWRENEWEKYKKLGYIDTLTGFRLSEIYRRNQIINSPIQGSCFHCLLWSLIKLNKWLKRKKFKSRIVCQIHDSILIDVWPKELQDVLHKMKYFATVAIRKHWDWLIVPLVVEAELCDVDASWFEKKSISI